MAKKWTPSLHPRGPNGRFTRSAAKKMTTAERTQMRAVIDGMKPVELVRQQRPKSPAANAYLDGGWRETNAALRAGKTPPNVAEIDKAMKGLPDDTLLVRKIPLDKFGRVPVDSLAGMKVRDAAYASTSLRVGDETPEPDMVTLHIAAPAGTLAISDADAAEVLLARNTEIGISKVEWNGTAWDVYGAVLPGEKQQLDGVSDDDVARYAEAIQSALRGQEALDAAPVRAEEGRLVTPPSGWDEERIGRVSASIGRYQGNDYTEINGQLRGLAKPDAETTANIADLDDVIAASALPNNLITYRGWSTVPGALKPHWRDSDLTGLTWADDAYGSTSADRRVAEGFAYRGVGEPVLIRTVLRKGTGALRVSNMAPPDRDPDGIEEEAELLTPRGARWRVIADHGHDETGRRRLDVEMMHE